MIGYPDPVPGKIPYPSHGPLVTWYISNWRKRKLQEQISQLNEKLILLLK